MKGIVLVLAAGIGGILFASAPATAEDTPAPKPAGTTPATPVVVSSDVVSTTPARRGLLARLRDRRSGNTMVTTPAVNTVVAPAPATTVPMTMPKPGTATPAAGTATATPMVTTAAYTVASQPTRTGLFSRFRNRNTMTTTPMPVMATSTPMSGVVPASGTVVTSPMTSSTPTVMTASPTTTTGRMGLLARLRARRG